MQEGGFHQSNRISPSRLAIVVSLHAAAIAALALTKMEVPLGDIFEPIEVVNVDLPKPPPPPEPEVQPKEAAPSRSQYDAPKVLVPTPPADFTVVQPRQDPVPFDPGPIGKADPQPRQEVVLPPAPPPQPARVEARLRSSGVQPPYPASEERLGNEGKVVVRVTIGADGRVKAVERVSATSDAFYRAAERHALRAWRFAPATEDGRPVESRRTMTVNFQLEG